MRNALFLFFLFHFAIVVNTHLVEMFNGSALFLSKSLFFNSSRGGEGDRKTLLSADN